MSGLGPPRGRTAWRLVVGGALLLCGLFADPPAARAQLQNPCIDSQMLGEVRCLDLQLFTPTANVGTTFTIDTPTVPRHLTFVFGLGGSFASGLLERSRVDPVTGEPDPDTATEIVPSLTQIELLAAIGLFEFVEVGLALPLAIASVPREDEPLAMMTITTESVTAPADPRLSLKVPLIRGDFALAGRAVFTLPISSTAEANFMSPGYWTMTPGAVAAWRFGALTLGADLGYRLRRRAAIGELEQDDEVHLAGGLAYAITPSFSAIAESQVRIGVGGRTTRSNEVPAEADLGVRWSPAPGVNIDVGGGTGILDGYGAPTFRAFAIARYATQGEDGCDAGPEDFDGFEDGDFCADLDNDGDGVEDSDDACPNDGEDTDGFLDEDGCPDTDNDADGVRDPEDECPLESEDIDGFQDENGCPEPDNDEDGLNDGVDECPNEPEDRDQFQDEDGCPEPGPEQATITVTDTRILISERVYFDYDTDTIRSVSQPLLDQLADVIRRLPANRRIRVEGHTDDAGDARYNLDLSYRRSRAVVQYLVGRNIPRRRLDFRGYGEEHPVAPNDTPEGRALNRRVEFTIVD